MTTGSDSHQRKKAKRLCIKIKNKQHTGVSVRPVRKEKKEHKAIL
jgi:hypothetical protein